MDISEIYSSLKNGKNFEYIQEDSISFHCANCKKELLEVEFIDGKSEHNAYQRYLYDDGDTIVIDEKYYPRGDSQMSFGSCKKCDSQIASISAAVLDKNVSSSCLSEEFKDCFVVYSEEDLVSSFKKAYQYMVCLNNAKIGVATIYKNAIVNKDNVHGLLENINTNIAVVSLECLSENETMSISDFGICNGHFENESQYDIWKKASFITTELIESVEKFLN